MEVMKRISTAGLVPVVVIDDEKDACPVARALMAGGIPVMEITYRTAAAPAAIREVAENCPDVLIGAGTVITLEQCKQAVEMGAKFIVSPGFSAEVVKWCVDNGAAVLPGCVTPSEIMEAMKLELDVVKFFPSNVYGGLTAMKSLAGPFTGIQFIPTGGINAQNVGEYIAAPFIKAVGGSWVCSRADIAAGNFEKITALCKEARQNMLGYEIAHVGINTADNDAAQGIAGEFAQAFGFPSKNGNSSVFASSQIEVMKNIYLGKNGHLAVRTNSIQIAVADLEQKGFMADMATAKYKGDRMIAVYLKDEIGGFAIHLLQK